MKQGDCFTLLNAIQVEWHQQDNCARDEMHRLLGRRFAIDSIECNGMSWLVERPHEWQIHEMPLSKSNCSISVLSLMCHSLKSRLLNWRILSAVAIFLWCLFFWHSFRSYFDWWWCYRRTSWIVFTNGENQIQFSWIPSFIHKLQSTDGCRNSTMQSHFFLLYSNWIFFPIGTECNLIAHQITIKCLTAYREPSPESHANVNEWQLQMILLFRFLYGFEVYSVPF